MVEVRNLLVTAHERISQVVSAGDLVVDATMGNGHDTLFLAKCVGSGGVVIAFDMQSDALVATRERLVEEGIEPSRFQLHQKSHAELNEYVTTDVAAVVFNLGYLPRADKSLVTQTDSTIIALNHSISCLRSGGVLSVMCYPGHSGGDAEAEAVVRWMKELEPSIAKVDKYQRINAEEKSPFLMVALKR